MLHGKSKGFSRPGPLGIVCGFIVFVLLIFADQLPRYYGLTDSQLILDDLCGGIVVGILVYHYQYKRTKYLKEKLKTIELMNHHVRNALQIIGDSVYLGTHVRETNAIQDAMNRIAWALEEILPGGASDDPELESARQQHSRRSAS
jgi:hypothetical protein